MRRALLGSWIALAGLTGCVPLPGTDLHRPVQGSVSFPVVAWVAPVTIADPELDDLDDRARLETALSLKLQGYLRDTHYFTSVNRLPGKVGPGDYVLRLRFDKYRVERDSHFGALLLSVFTLGISESFGVHVVTMTSELAAELGVVDAEGKMLAKASDEKVETYPYDGAYGDLDTQATDRRTLFVETLVATAVQGLQP